MSVEASFDRLNISLIRVVLTGVSLLVVVEISLVEMVVVLSVSLCAAFVSSAIVVRFVRCCRTGLRRIPTK